MTVQLWSDYARDEWARMADPLSVDEEPWTPAGDSADLLDVAPAVVAWWMTLTAGVVAALVAVLVLLGLGRLVGGGHA